MPGMRIRKQQQQQQQNHSAGIVMEEQQEDQPLESSSISTTTTPLLSDDIRGAAAQALSPSSSAASGTNNVVADETHYLEMSNDGDRNGNGNSGIVPPVPSFRRLLFLLTSPLTDDQGRQPLAIVMGHLSMALGGIVLGILLPKSSSLPSRVAWLPAFVSYRTISSCIGYTYFLSWSMSFYPQLVSNFRRKTTAGLSADFCVLNVLGFSCYTAYNVALFTSPMIRRLYHERHHHHHQHHSDYDEQQQQLQDDNDNNGIPVQSNDVAFAVHALLVSSMTLFQIGYYDGFRSQQPSKVISAIILVMLTIIISLPIYILIRGGGTQEIASNTLTDNQHLNYHLNWLDYLYVLSTIKVTITLIKYMPQVVLNCRRQSTIGWSIWQILLDMTGGVLSDLQLVLDCAALQDWTGITGNLAKLVLGSASILFDLIFFLQHYVLYKSAASSAATTTPTTPLLLSNNNNSSYEQLLQASDNNEGTATAGDETRDIDEGPIHSFV